jgi:hypothetical protein
MLSSLPEKEKNHMSTDAAAPAPAAANGKRKIGIAAFQPSSEPILRHMNLGEASGTFSLKQPDMEIIDRYREVLNESGGRLKSGEPDKDAWRAAKTYLFEACYGSFELDDPSLELDTGGLPEPAFFTQAPAVVDAVTQQLILTFPRLEEKKLVPPSKSSSSGTIESSKTAVM